MIQMECDSKTEEFQLGMEQKRNFLLLDIPFTMSRLITRRVGRFGVRIYYDTI